MPRGSGYWAKRQRTDSNPGQWNNSNPGQIIDANSSQNNNAALSQSTNEAGGRINTANPMPYTDGTPSGNDHGVQTQYTNTNIPPGEIPNTNSSQNTAGSPRPARASPEPLLPAKDDDFILDKKGDLVLVIGTGQQRIRLRSDVLKQVSPIFEGKLSLLQGINVEFDISRAWCEIHLVEDNADAFKIFCSLIYGQQLPEYDYITVSQIFELALLAAKYQCQDRLFYGTEYFFPRVRSSWLSSEETWKLYAAAYLLNRPGDFQKYANELISSHKGSFVPFAELIPDVPLAAKLCC